MDIEQLEADLATYVVMCWSSGCENYGIALVIPAEAQNPQIVCGHCGNRIVDVTLVGATRPPSTDGGQ